MGEGFDDARLDTLFLTLPVSWHGTIAQYAGRLHRLYNGKREVRIYDYADLNVPMLARMFNESSVEVPADFGVLVTKKNIGQHLADLRTQVKGLGSAVRW